jgi:hypothetical protein
MGKVLRVVTYIVQHKPNYSIRKSTDPLGRAFELSEKLEKVKKFVASYTWLKGTYGTYWLVLYLTKESSILTCLILRYIEGRLQNLTKCIKQQLAKKANKAITT